VYEVHERHLDVLPDEGMSAQLQHRAQWESALSERLRVLRGRRLRADGCDWRQVLLHEMQQQPPMQDELLRGRGPRRRSRTARVRVRRSGPCVHVHALMNEAPSGPELFRVPGSSRVQAAGIRCGAPASA
jgi:hypothetical protein